MKPVVCTRNSKVFYCPYFRPGLPTRLYILVNKVSKKESFCLAKGWLPRKIEMSSHKKWVFIILLFVSRKSINETILGYFREYRLPSSEPFFKTLNIVQLELCKLSCNLGKECEKNIYEILFHFVRQRTMS